MAAMKKWKQAPEDLVALFDAVVPGGGPAERRKMFGYPCVFVGGNMAAGLHEDRFIVRLPEEARDTLVARGGKPFEPMPGRFMREYVVLPAAVLGDRKALRGWVEKALAYAGSLPSRTPGAGRKKKSAPKKKSRA